jgi:hypothetical protein
MKKFLNTMLVTAAVVAASTTANAATAGGKVAQGAYLGATAGAANTNVKASWIANNPTVVAPSTTAAETRLAKTDAGKMAGIFGLVAGYNFQSGSLVFGGEIYGGFDSTKVTVFDDSGSGNSTEAALWTSSVKRTNFMGFAPRFGFMLAPNTLMYARLGMEVGKWKAQITPNQKSIDLAVGTTGVTTDGTAASRKDTQGSKGGFSFAPGLGMEVYMGKAFLRAQYSYLFGPKITLTQDVRGYAQATVNGQTATHTYKMSQHKVELAVGYKF